MQYPDHDQAQEGSLKPGPAQPDGRRRSPGAAAWLEVLRLGERLVSEISRREGDCQQVCRQLILQAVTQITGGTADLWLAPDASSPTPDPADRSGGPGADTIHAQPPLRLMRRSLQRLSVCKSRSTEIDQSGPREHDRGAGRQSLAIAIPLLTAATEAPDRRALGVLQVERPAGPGFDRRETALLEGIAAQAALALHIDQQRAAERRRASHLAAVYEVSKAITSILDLEELLHRVVTLIQERFGYPYVYIYDVHPGRRKIFFQAGSIPHSQDLHQQRFAYDLDAPQGIIPWVARTGKTLLVNDVELEPRFRPSPLVSQPTRSELSVPLTFGDDVLGILDVQSDAPGVFREEDRSLFEALADHVAVAMRNAYLYRSERWRRQVADSLREVAGLLAGDASLDQVIEAALAELERSLPCDVASIWLLEDGSSTVHAPGIDHLKLAAVHGAQSSRLQSVVGMDLPAIHASPIQAAGSDHNQESDWLGAVMAAGQPMLRPPQAAYEPLGAILAFSSNYSAIASPLLVGEQCVGILALAHHAENRYGSEALAMIEAFASYAAVAIHNARLYKSAEEQAWITSVLLQVAEATQALTNLNDLLDTVVRLTPTLLGFQYCAIYLLDEGGALIPAAASGLSSEQKVVFERWRFAPGDVPIFDQALQEKRLVVLQALQDILPLSEILSLPKGSGESTESQWLVCLPFVVHGDVLGVFLATCPLTPAALLKGDTYLDDRLTILQGIAHQTAVAIENLHLVKLQKEDAYVSVALLQVAQAVVSSNDLAESLGAIVRITPILVGVKRCAIFLWDQENGVFRLSQAYGMPRSVEGRSFAAGEFPLLEAVYHEDRLIACPRGAEQAVDVLTQWTTIAPPGIAESKSSLSERCRLLLAFPLSVKADVLGVLLVEERETAMVGSYGEGVILRAREKRLEITTGISQQAALAVQNDRLQKEMVRRERLEREMQLARDIQRAFLPRLLPRYQEWDLDVMWRTARQVGGDYYDFLELPGNRLALIVADVADKGIPAALFMTLVRTLIRATLPVVDAPGEVLARVNDVLTPDAQQGMFVTLVYAVLSLDSGVLTYANAGHNPPLLVEIDAHAIRRLEKGGMALGVEEGNRVTERQVQLKPGDILVFYTDGVTEVFAADGRMFGEEGLRQSILNWSADASLPSAEGLLMSIDDAICAFREDAPFADDVTLVVLRRRVPGEPGLEYWQP